MNSFITLHTYQKLAINFVSAYNAVKMRIIIQVFTSIVSIPVRNMFSLYMHNIIYTCLGEKSAYLPEMNVSLTFAES